MVHPKIQEAIQQAERDIRRLRDAKSSRGAKSAWISFLENANRALNRLERVSKRTGQTGKFKALMTKEIWSSDLTKYMRLARHEHEHGIEELHVDEPFNQRVAFPDGWVLGAPIVYGTAEDGQTTVMPACQPMEFSGMSAGARVIALKPGIRLVPVTDNKGNMVMPPFVQIETEDEAEPLAAMKLYLAWVVDQIANFD